ncbi:hypothetical protein B0T16DRAFT_48970 [Cercophora newfieldiana]|uniref:N-acetyltransferase domain-containing protein n=1 Tax=Cercophora newfieldiana TaxID=92897 RepID=A0AA40CZ35_9PEZI|nr:hypothetical protein B0T16DRAFT_48970 [Cercophora newfieldiana]
MAAPKPRLCLREATPADASALAEIHFAAFGPFIVNQLLFPGGITADAKEKAASSMFSPPDPKSSSERLIVVAELVPEDGPPDGPGEIVAFAKWSLRRKPVPEEEWNAPQPPLQPDMLGEGGNIEVYDWFIGNLHRRLKEHVRGDAMLYLGTLVSSPHRQRLGAGAALLRWGADLADSLGLDIWLEASPQGYPLYKKHGYEDVAVVDSSFTERWGVTKPEGHNWGENSALEVGGPVAEGSMRSVIMKRPKASN